MCRSNRRCSHRNPERVRQAKANWRANNRDAIRALNRKKSTRLRSERRAWLDALKLERGCTDCGYNAHPRALEWDHIGTDKVANVGYMVHEGASMERLLLEIAKCEVVCANCHRIRTHDRLQNPAPERAPSPLPASAVFGQFSLFDEGAT